MLTAPPLPASPCLRVRLDYGEGDNALAGSRFYLSYSGSAPTAANCTTLATDIANTWASDIAPQISNTFGLVEVDVLDIATLSGASGTVSVSHGGGQSGATPAAAAAQNIEYTIARRYRGGKPRMYLPPADASNMQDGGHWTDAQVTATGTAISSFFTAIEALSVGAIGTLAHVNLSYYSGFKNITNSSGRERAVPTYRTQALLDTVTGYNVKKLIGSQRRRRAATTY